MTSDVFDCKVPNAIPQEGHGLIYLYTFDNGMMYVGQTRKTIRHRHTGHTNGDQMVDNYIRTHPFRLEILEICSMSELDNREQYFIKELDTMRPNGLNFESGGHDNKTMSTETREKMSASAKIICSDPEHVARRTATLKKKCEDPEYKKILSERSTRGWSTEESRQKASKAAKKRYENPAEREKTAKSLRGKKLSPEARASLVAKRDTPEYRAKLSKANMGHPVSEEARKKMSLAKKGKKQTPEAIAKRTEGLRRAWARRKSMGEAC